MKITTRKRCLLAYVSIFDIYFRETIIVLVLRIQQWASHGSYINVSIPSSNNLIKDAGGIPNHLIYFTFNKSFYFKQEKSHSGITAGNWVSHKLLILFRDLSIFSYMVILLPIF